MGCDTNSHISGSFYTIIKSFLPGKFIKIINVWFYLQPLYSIFVFGCLIRLFQWCLLELPALQHDVETERVWCMVEEKNWSVSMRCQKLSWSVTFLTIEITQENSLNKEQNILEIEFEFSFLTKAFIFTFCFFVSMQRGLPRFVYSDADENRDTMWGFVVWFLRSWERDPLHVYVLISFFITTTLYQHGHSFLQIRKQEFPWHQIHSKIKNKASYLQFEVQNQHRILTK